MSDNPPTQPRSGAGIATEGSIRKTPGVCGGEARVRDTRISVWGLVESRRLGLSDPEILERVEGLTEEDLRAAWDYARRHPREIEAAISRNEAP